MSSPALVVFRHKQSFSCGVYLFFDGDPIHVMEALDNAAPRMRKGDIEYCSARFCGYMHEQIPGPYSLGLWSPLRRRDLENFEYVPKYGVYVVDTLTGRVIRHFFERRGNPIDDPKSYDKREENYQMEGEWFYG